LDIISTEDMKNYMDMVLNSKELERAYLTCNTPSDASYLFQNIGNILAKYYISTGDNSLESAKELLSNYLSLSDKESFFRIYLMPKIEKTVASILNFDSDLSFQDRVRIQEFVKTRNANNLFYTHCFPGALYDEVSTNGLDISKELFKEEYRILATCPSFKTAFKVGELNYCELSSASLSYATSGIPERAKFAVGGFNKQEKEETLHDTLAKNLEKTLNLELEKGTITRLQMETIRQSGMKIIDFYCISKSCIAFFRRDSIPQHNTNIKKHLLNRLKKFETNIHGTYLGALFQTKINEADKNPDKAEEILLNAFDSIVILLPELKSVVDAYIEDSLAYTMSTMAINNYTHGGFADGYALEEGKLSPEKMGIVRITTPSEFYVQHFAHNKNKTTQVPEINKQQNNPTAKINYKSVFNELTLYDRTFKEILASGNIPQTIEQAKIFWDDKTSRQIFLTTNAGQVRPVGVPKIQEINGIPIYSTFSGNVDSSIIQSIEFEFDNFPQERKDKIFEQYKQAVPEYDENYLEEDASNWYATQKFESLNESEKDTRRKSFLDSKPKFVIHQKDGKCLVAPIIDGKINKAFPCETIYSRNADCKYNNLFNAMLEESLPLSNYHSSLFETESCQRIMQNLDATQHSGSEILKKQLTYANELYTESLKSIGFAGIGGNYAIQKIAKNPVLKKLLKNNPRALSLLKFIAEKEAKQNPSKKLSYLNASVRICEEINQDVSPSV